MSKGTPISKLRMDQDNSQMVQNILNEMDGQQGGGQPMPQMPQGQQPLAPQQPQYQQEDFEPQMQQYEEQYEPQYQENFGGGMNQFKELSTNEQLMEELKEPLLVVLLVLLANLEVVNSFLVKNLPKVLIANGELNLWGLVVKATLAGVLFYVVRRFFL